MTNRRGFPDSRTNRPSIPLTPERVTVGEVLALEAVRAGSPEVLTGHQGLGETVRWLHVAESPPASSFLKGGELVLTTGTTWPSTGRLTAHTEALLDAGAVCLVVELGSRFSSVPEVVVQACELRGVPLVALHREVSFVAVTEAAHRLLVASQIAVLQARDDVQALFTEFNRVGASADHIVTEVARLIASPVVLEDLAHRVVCCAPYDRAESAVLWEWEVRSRSGTGGRGARRVVDVAARGRRWGRLVAISVPSTGPVAVVNHVLSQGALALSLDAMAAQSEHGASWDTIRQGRTIEALLGHRFNSDAHLLRLLESAGLAVHSSPAIALGWTVPRQGGTGNPGWVDRAREAATRVASRLRIQVLSAPLATVPGGMLALLVIPADQGREPGQLLVEFVAQLRRGPAAVDLTVAGRLVTPTGRNTEELLASVAEARDLLETVPPGNAQLMCPRGSEIDELTRSVPVPQLQEFVEELIGPLLSYDARHGTDLLSVLEAYLRYPANRTRAAEESRLSRSVFYQRLELLESQLGRDLHDGNTLAALHVAVSMRRRAADNSG